MRCDIPANVYQSTFSPNTQWSEEFAQGPEIRAYWQGLAKKYGVYQNVEFRSKVAGSYWEEKDAQWRLEIEDVSTGEKRTASYDFLITAIGHFNDWKLPDYPGIKDFKGHLRHSSDWDPSFDPRGKRIATIGNGASGIQVTPELQKVAKHVDHYARSRTWVAGSFSGHERKAEPMLFSEEKLKEFQDPAKYLQYRKEIEEAYWRRYESQLKDSPANKRATEEFKELMRKRLTEKPELLEQLVPEFAPHCRRLTPGPGYLEALQKDNVEFIQTPIERFTEDGIVTVDGKHRPVDAIICSTGANVDFAPPFPLVSGDKDLSKAWRPEGEDGFPYTYIGLATPGFPNLLFLHGRYMSYPHDNAELMSQPGPNGAGASGTLPHSVENQATYIARLLRKVSTQGIRTIVPLKEAADDFIQYCDAFFPKTVLSEKCSSWANGRRPGQRIHGLWPGSAAHVNHVRRDPRWEDYRYTYVRPENRFAYWGNGWTKKERDAERDIVPYLKLPEEIDLRDYHESWWDL